MVDQDRVWAVKQDAIFDKGDELVGRASDEALRYMVDIADNMDDKAWRKMAIESQALEMGVGDSLANSLVPNIYEDMRKKLHRRLKVSKDTSKMMRTIYIGRVIKNIVKELT